MWWKLYFILSILIGIFTVFDIFTNKNIIWPIYLVYIIVFFVGIIGQYSYIFRKRLFSLKFWIIFLYFALILDILYVLASLFPNIPLLSYLLYSKEVVPLEATIFGIVFNLPYYFMLYQLNKGKLLEKKEEDNKVKPWSLLQIAIWGYSLVFSFILIFLTLLPQENSTTNNDHSFVFLLFSPFILFWILVFSQRKQYKWSWWKKALAITSGINSFFIFFGTFLPSSGSTTTVSLVTIVPIIITFLGFFILGKDKLSQRLY